MIHAQSVKAGAVSGTWSHLLDSVAQSSLLPVDEVCMTPQTNPNPMKLSYASELIDLLLYLEPRLQAANDF